MRTSFAPILIVVAIAAFSLPALGTEPSPAARMTGEGRHLPAFDEERPSRWINSEPLTLEDLRGKVALAQVWTFGCGNCVRSIPWLRELERRYTKKGAVLIGVHSPEFDYERPAKRVAEFAETWKLDFPILVDDGMKYWRALGNRYWPTLYLVDRSGRIRHVHVGETHSGTDRAAAVERIIEELLWEAPPG